jgi:hypothetical protein
MEVHQHLQTPTSHEFLPTPTHQLTPSLVEQANKIEKLIQRLRGEGPIHEMWETALDEVQTLFSYSELANYSELSFNLAGEELEFLANILPPHVLDDPLLHNVYEASAHFNVEGLFFKVADLGFSGLSLILKSKILNQTSQLLEQIKKNYKNKALPNEIKEWEVRIQSQKAILREHYLDYGLDVARDSLLMARFPLKILSETASISQPLITGLGAGGLALMCLIASVDLAKHSHMASTHQTWLKHFKKWQKKVQPQVDLLEKKWETKKTEHPSSIALKDYQLELQRLIHTSKDMDSIRSKFKIFNIHLSLSIKTKTELLQNWAYKPDFRTPLVEQYASYQTLFLKLQHAAESSQNLLEKRQARSELKLLQLRPRFQEMIPQLQEFMHNSRSTALLRHTLMPEFNQAFEDLLQKAPEMTLAHIQAQVQAMGFFLSFKTKKEAYEELARIKDNALEFSQAFRQWLWIKPRDSLLRAYIDHQETIAQTTKNALISIVDKKHELEDKFLSFKLNRSRALFSLVVTSLVISAVIGALVIASIPLGGAPLILLLLSFSTTGVSFGLLGAGAYMTYKYKPSQLNVATHLKTIAMSLQSLYLRIQHFSQVSKQQQLQETAQIIHNLRATEGDDKAYQKALNQYKRIKAQFEENQIKIEKWNKKSQKLADRLKASSWKDFAHFAQLSISPDAHSFDTLKALKEALESTDFSLLDADTKSFFEQQLGIDVSALQKDPAQIEENLKDFLTLQEEQLIQFIEHQEARLKAGLI